MGNQTIMLVWVENHHDIVQLNAGEDNGLDLAGVVLQHGKETAEAVGQYTKCILHHSPGSLPSIIEESLFVGHVPACERFLQPGYESQYFVTNDVSLSS